MPSPVLPLLAPGWSRGAQLGPSCPVLLGPVLFVQGIPQPLVGQCREWVAVDELPGAQVEVHFKKEISLIRMALFCFQEYSH